MYKMQGTTRQLTVKEQLVRVTEFPGITEVRFPNGTVETFDKESAQKAIDNQMEVISTIRHELRMERISFGEFIILERLYEFGFISDDDCELIEVIYPDEP